MESEGLHPVSEARLNIMMLISPDAWVNLVCWHVRQVFWLSDRSTFRVFPPRFGVTVT
jgi:hypothetical protein